MPNTSSSQKVFKSKEFIEEEDDNETSASEIEQYNIMNRPKRNIILNTNSLSIDQIQLNDSDSEDEDFHVENSNSYSSCNSSSSCSNSSGEDDDDDVDENEQINTSQNDLNESNQVGKEHSDSNGVVKTKRKYTKRKTKNAEQDENGEAKKKPKKEKTPSTKSPRTTKTSTKKSKKKLKKILDAKKLELNHENDKILSTFKNVKTSAKQQLNKQVKANRISNGIKEETHHEQTFNLTHSTCSGPFVRQLVHEDSSSKYSTYIVISNNVNDLNGVDLTNDANTKIDTLLPKEKLEQIDDPNNVINWVCSLCHFKPNCYDGLGPLFGPYKIRLTDTDSDLKESDLVKEIWLHEGCAVWNSSIFIKDNQVHGIEECLNHANNIECSSCKKKGATLTCNKLGCNRNYHYPCAILNNCNLNNENLTVQCKIHSTHQIKR